MLDTDKRKTLNVKIPKILNNKPQILLAKNSLKACLSLIQSRGRNKIFRHPLNLHISIFPSQDSSLEKLKYFLAKPKQAKSFLNLKFFRLVSRKSRPVHLGRVSRIARFLIPLY